MPINKLVIAIDNGGQNHEEFYSPYKNYFLKKWKPLFDIEILFEETKLAGKCEFSSRWVAYT